MTNDEDNKTIDEEMEEFIDMINNKRIFHLSINCGSVVPITNPNYYVGRKDIILEKDTISNQIYKTKVDIERETYNIDNTIIDEIMTFTKENLNRLIQIAINQNTEVYFGGYHSIMIKINSILISISPLNAKNEEDSLFLNQFEEKIINIILNNR